ncbi:MAG: Eco57I restriction-modification methylase domain-containing protein [Bacteroidetes bacterium]|nr:Eco57I restriction-modification methylase domain-containing protein [Bacteroidota bacterium]MBU1423260.1 Eco57I restriction-modification methylase domain-containing protein [Bacteroidota bacterium]MBU2471207.1 Eco57I restriction-modification methylase domain-containing protein [Bacteroidota bacterium]MBU2636403.1 Eco57I restriction-modification methylase domain-containing protein [Bacteroidota bacterium]
MAFADIACGSGSFLIEVYTQLLDYHTKYYLDHPEQAKKGDIETREGKTVLSLKKRQEILTNNIYGVDIDFQATEVTQLSLYLKLLEDVTMNDAFQYSLLKEKILPDLRNNIVCGNSLIGTDILEGKLFDSEEERKLNPMNFEDAFPKVMQKGGFDAVVGNPPYRKERDSIEFIADLKRSKFGKQYYEGKMNLWYFFLHRAIELTKKGGFISFIVSSYWLKGSGARKLIQHVKAECSFVDTVEFTKNKIFDKVSGQHMIFTVIRDKKNQKVKCQRFTSEGLHPNEIARVLTEKSAKQSQVYSVDEVQFYTIDGKINFGLGSYLYILSHLEKSSFQLENGSGSFEVSQGIVEAPDSISRAVAEYANQPELAGEGVFVLSKREIKKIRFNEREKLFIKRYLHAADVSRYHWQFSGYFVFYIGNKENKQIDRARWLYPNISRHLDRYKGFITSSNRPYGIHRTRESRFFASEKLLCPNMFDRPNFAYCVDEYYVNFAFNVIISGQTSYSLKYLLGLLNSKLGAFWFNINGKKRGINNDVGVAVMRQFPVHRINFSNLAEIDWHDNIVNLVEQMLSAKQRAAAAKTDAEINKLELQIDSLDRKIDEAVYELYGLTEEEIRTVEGDGG